MRPSAWFEMLILQFVHVAVVASLPVLLLVGEDGVVGRVGLARDAREVEEVRHRAVGGVLVAADVVGELLERRFGQVLAQEVGELHRGVAVLDGDDAILYQLLALQLAECDVARLLRQVAVRLDGRDAGGVVLVNDARLVLRELELEQEVHQPLHVQGRVAQRDELGGARADADGQLEVALDDDRRPVEEDRTSAAGLAVGCAAEVRVGVAEEPVLAVRWVLEHESLVAGRVQVGQ